MEMFPLKEDEIAVKKVSLLDQTQYTRNSIVGMTTSLFMVFKTAASEAFY